MCGIFIAIERHQPVDLGRARRAIAALRHRGPDGSGEYAFTCIGNGAPGPRGIVGHTRLAIQDPVQRSAQPLRRDTRTLSYNGEIYNFRALRQTLRQRGHHFETEGDTEVLLALLADQGVEGLNQAHGMWAFGLLDEAAQTLMAARDRYGKKPLFWHADAQRICLASEVAPLMLYLDRAPEMVGADIDSYLRDGWLFPRPDGATHIRDVREVPPGSCLQVDLARWTWQTGSYHSVQLDTAGPPAEADALANQLEEAVQARLVSDRRIGLLLSGGVDSSLILSILAARGWAEQVTCFTGDAGKSDDATYARQCIEQLGIPAISLPLDYGAGGMASFLDVCRHQEKPFPFIGNVLAMPQLYARIAEHDVPVVLDGTGGDELFAGYWDRYHRFALREALAQGDTAWVEASLAAQQDDAGAQARARQALDFARSHPEAFADPGGIDRAAEDPADLDEFVQPQVRHARRVDPLRQFPGGLSEALLLDAGAGRLSEWLWQNDRNAMTHGIENRSPLLDHRLAGWMRSDFRNKFVGPWNKHELRSAFPAFVPLPTQWRRDKQGFRWVYHRFLKNNRSEVLALVAGSRLLRGRVDVARLLDAARNRDDYLECGLLQRMFCLAGLEETMGLR
ncbi:MAG: asparagine synthase (glutamine-hydrolyzing) [Rhodoferax sp.]